MLNDTQLKTRLSNKIIPATLVGVSLLFGGVIGAFLFTSIGDEPTAPPVWKKPTNGAIGNHHALVILFYNAAEAAPTSPTKADIQTLVNTKIGPYVSEVSRGRMTLHGALDVNNAADVVGWVSITGVDAKGAAMAAAKAADPAIDFRNYSWVYFVSRCPACTEGGMGGTYSAKSTPDGWSIFADPWINLTAALYGNVWIHEAGHSVYTNNEGYFMDCGAKTYGDPTASCTRRSYQTAYDPMGGSTVNMPYFNTRHREFLGWLRTGEVLTYSASETGSKTYTISPAELANTNLKVLRVERTATSFAYIEFRQAIGFDSFLGGDLDSINGALIHYVNPASTNQTYLVDGEPAISGRLLGVGKTFVDQIGHFQITVNSVSPSGMSVTVTRT